MKCKFCGSNLQIEDERCPYCGRPNPQYIKHRRAMQAYQEDYQNTKQEVLTHVSKLNRRSVRITIVAVLVALCAVALVLCFMGDEIRDARIAANKETYAEQIQEYMAEVDPINLYEFGYRNRLTYSKAMDEYNKVFSISMYYQYFYNYTMELMTEGIHEKYETLEEKCEYMARYVENIYENRERQTYDKDYCYTEDKTAYMDAIVERTELLLKAYYGLSEEEIASVPTLSRARLTILLAEGYENE